MDSSAIGNLKQERNKANLLENFVYVSGVGVGSILLADGIKRTFKKEATLQQRVVGILATLLGGVAALESANLLMSQKSIRNADAALDAALWGTFVGGMDF